LKCRTTKSGRHNRDTR